MSEDENTNVSYDIQFGGCLVLIIILMLGVFVAATHVKEEPRGLVVNERDGWVYVNTSPYQIKKLDPWKQPRLSFQVRWFEQFERMELRLHFIYYSRGQRALEHTGVQWRDDYGKWHNLPSERAGNVSVAIFTLEHIQNWAYSKELMFRVYGIEFYPDRMEHDNMLQLAWLCGRK